MSPQQPRAKMLLLAYACAPFRGSEPGVGWNWALQTARFFDTWVITREQGYGETIRRYLSEHGEIPGLHFVYVPRSWFQQLLMKTPGLYYLGYRGWQRRAFRAARRLHADVGFDLVRQATFMTYREPGYCWKLGIPFIWGPWGGTQNYPWRFLSLAGPLGAVQEGLRSVANFIQLRISHRIARGAAKAALLLASNSSIAEDFAAVHHHQPEILAGNGIDAVDDERPWSTESRPLRILWVGRLESLKALPLLLYALRQVATDTPFELRIVGQGSKRATWERLTERLGLQEQVTFLPHQSVSELWEQYRWADLFVMTSLRDTLPTVVLEALSVGLPVLGLDHHGMSDLVSPACGVLVPVERPTQVIDALARELRGLAADPERRRRMRTAALRQAERFLWDNQGRQMAELCWLVVEARDGRPHTPLAA